MTQQQKHLEEFVTIQHMLQNNPPVTPYALALTLRRQLTLLDQWINVELDQQDPTISVKRYTDVYGSLVDKLAHALANHEVDHRDLYHPDHHIRDNVLGDEQLVAASDDHDIATLYHYLERRGPFTILMAIAGALAASKA